MNVSDSTKFAFLLLVAFSIFVSGQEKKDATTEKQILLNASVFSYEGKIVKDLKKESFRLLEDNKPIEISYFSSENSPISIGILIDVSRSMGSGVDLSREGILSFIEKSNVENEYFAAAFSKQIDLVEDFAKADKITEIISSSPYFTKMPKPGELALYDAIKFGIENLSKAKNQRKALFVFSFVRRKYSSGDYKQIEKLVRERNITVYPVYCGFDSDVFSGNLDELAEISGGKSFYRGDIFPKLNSSEEYFKLEFSKLADWLQNQYVIGFKPNLESKENKWRKLELKLDLTKELRKQTGKSFVSHRTGYYPFSEAVINN